MQYGQDGSEAPLVSGGGAEASSESRICFVAGESCGVCEGDGRLEVEAEAGS